MARSYSEWGKQKWNKTLYKPEYIAAFTYLEQVKIGKNYFNDEELIKHFISTSSDDIILLKQVFQEEYPITRTYDNLPRVPSRQDQKLILIQCMTKYFNRLRSKIIDQKYKSGDSVSLRELIDEFQVIKTLKEHFEETKDTFPYHMFKDYLNNKDFINLKGDIQTQVRAFEQKKVQDVRIRNLLRQFAMTYIKNKNNNKFTVRDPGVGEYEFKQFIGDQEIEGEKRPIDIFEEVIAQSAALIEAKQNQNQNPLEVKKSSEGGAQDTLLDYCNKVANDSLNTFLSEEPLPFFSLIQDFEKASKMDVLRSTNEEYILKLFIQRHLEENFETKEMKEFYFHAKELFGKQDCSEYAKMFFVLNEIVNVIRDSKEDIDIVRIKSKEYNSSFDYLEYMLKGYEYDFYNVAKKKFVLDENDMKQMDLSFKDTIFICINKGKKTYDFNKNLTLKRNDFDYKEDISYINSQMVYLFFILSTHFYLQSENMIDNDEYIALNNTLEKTVRKLKRTKNKEKRSIEKLFKERKEFKLDG